MILEFEKKVTATEKAGREVGFVISLFIFTTVFFFVFWRTFIPSLTLPYTIFISMIYMVYVLCRVMKKVI